MFNLLKRKAIVAVITFFISLISFGNIFRSAIAGLGNTFMMILLVGIVSGATLSIAIDYIVKNSFRYVFIFRFTLYIVIAFLMNHIFLRSSSWEIFLYFILPVAMLYFLVDEFVRRRLS
ncbi:hypothetical protein N781_15500 [Pontibacillus halophilus JSM 076056 = DSM 19796]|uniref:Permease n=1 Tax=Pontibacillus halophilus JSM 076056 = DSM 19796 TaxID=1385510 RepID=A0A0A5IAD5_9BACI|nr:hypothetical protein [Pontibacillus halophilus]KGX92797.1 hypothetical protein N781_15500 [Pontibacillus halophilus JSM 076056 = DSM 19796]